LVGDGFVIAQQFISTPPLRVGVSLLVEKGKGGMWDLTVPAAVNSYQLNTSGRGLPDGVTYCLMQLYQSWRWWRALFLRGNLKE
jgi:hypothetical protein